MIAQPAPATVLAFDFGTRRIGVAVGNTITRCASPLTTIDAAQGSERFARIETLVAQWQPARLVVGIPVHADGAEHVMTVRARQFADELEARFRLPVVHADERHTTQLAQGALNAAGAGRRGRSQRDEVAAQLILQRWFDEHDAADS